MSSLIEFMNVDTYGNSIVVDCLDLHSNSSYTGNLTLFTKNMLAFLCKDSHFKDEAVSRPSHLYVFIVNRHPDVVGKSQNTSHPSLEDFII